MVSRRQVLASITGVSLIGGGAGGYSFLRQQKTIFDPDIHPGEVKEHSFTLNKRSFLTIDRPISSTSGRSAYTIYSDTSPRDIIAVLTKGNINEAGDVNGLVLPPGTYHVAALHYPPEIKATEYFYLRETSEPESIPVSHYLDVISLFTDAGEEEPIFGYKAFVVPSDYYSEEEVIGMEPGEIIFSDPNKWGAQDPEEFIRRLEIDERVIRPQVERIGGSVQQRYEEILQENRRVPPTVYVFDALPNLHQNSGMFEESYKGLLTQLLEDAELRSKVSDARNAVGSEWYLKPADLENETTGTVQVGLRFDINSAEVSTLDQSKVVYSPTVEIPVTRTQSSPAIWEVGLNLEQEIMGLIREVISE